MRGTYEPSPPSVSLYVCICIYIYMYAHTLYLTHHRKNTHSPADRPAPVPDLRDLPTGGIKRIAAGGYVVLALTEGNDLYAWGGGGGGRAPLSLLTGAGGGPAPVVVEEQGVEADDILDCAVGDAHAVVLTGEGHVYVVGDNGNGQLGLPAAAVESWTRVAVPGTAVAVAAGPRSSFVVTRHHSS